MITSRLLAREEIQKVWSIDRSEVVENVYRFTNGRLELTPEHHDVRGWPPGEAEKYTPLLMACFDRGGWFHGLFDRQSLIAVAILDPQFIGRHQDRLQLKFLHVSKPYRGEGLGQRLFELAKHEARKRG